MARRLRGPVCFQGNIAGWNLKGSFYIIHCRGCRRFGGNSDQWLKGKTLFVVIILFFTEYIDTRQCLLMYIQLPSKCSRSATQFSLRPSVMKKFLRF